MNLENDPSTALETSLRRALRRESPAPGFASRVMQRIERDQAPARRPWWRAVAASLTLTALVGGGIAYQDHQRQVREGEQAKEQVLLALRIAGEKVRYAQHEVRSIGSND
ncbi:MAG TPA: hypothetical protein VF432_20920 [Thermoanaerobaculia bacterium]